MCGYSDNTDYEYILSFEGGIPEKVAECSYNCPEPCNYSKYEVKLSYASAIDNSFTRNLEALMLSKTDEEKLQPFISIIA